MANMNKLRRDYGDNILWTGKKCFMGLPISFTRYIITDTVLYTRIGFLNIKEDEVELYKVTDKTMKFTFGQRIFGCGTIHIRNNEGYILLPGSLRLNTHMDASGLKALRGTNAAFDKLHRRILLWC